MDNLMQKLAFRVQVVSIFSGLSKDEIRTADYKDVNKVFNACIEMLSGYEQSEPSGVIEHDGKRYVFDKDIFGFNTGQAIDMKLIEDIYSDPYEVLAILYIEEGMEYNQIDERKKVINPNVNRKRIFEEAFPGDEFLNLFAFFLQSWESLKVAMSILKTAQTEVMMEMEMKNLKKEVEKLKTRNGSNGQPI